jgi:hypothetical protein
LLVRPPKFGSPVGGAVPPATHGPGRYGKYCSYGYRYGRGK